jgi:hypothetical protein
MKIIRFLLIATTISLMTASCSVFKRGSGCPTNGKNVGAEKLLDGDSPKAKKFRA